MKLDSIVGTRVNRFIVQEKIKMPKATGGSEILYKCLCDCGKAFYVPSRTLQRNPPRDCGCGIRTPLPKEELEPSIETPPIEEDLPMTEDGIAPSVPLRWQDVSIPDSKMGYFLECLKQKLSSSKQVYRGVKLKKFLHRYHAYIRVDDKEIGLGTYVDINEAAIARLKAEIFYRGGVQARMVSKRKYVSKPKVVSEHVGIVNRVGERHFAFIVLKYAGPKGNKEMWLCKCDCGNHFFASSGDIENDNVKDCGCGLGNVMRKPYKNHLCSSFAKYEVGGTNLAMFDGCKLNRRNKSGVRGVYLDSKTGKWMAKIVLYGVVHRKKCNSKSDAIASINRMRKEIVEPLMNGHLKHKENKKEVGDDHNFHHDLRFQVTTTQ